MGPEKSLVECDIVAGRRRLSKTLPDEWWSFKYDRVQSNSYPLILNVASIVVDCVERRKDSNVIITVNRLESMAL